MSDMPYLWVGITIASTVQKKRLVNLKTQCITPQMKLREEHDWKNTPACDPHPSPAIMCTVVQEGGQKESARCTDTVGLKIQEAQ
jgi:hypothetical protein